MDVIHIPENPETDKCPACGENDWTVAIESLPGPLRGLRSHSRIAFMNASAGFA